MIGDDNNAPPKVRNAAAAAKNLKKKRWGLHNDGVYLMNFESNNSPTSGRSRRNNSKLIYGKYVCLIDKKTTQQGIDINSSCMSQLSNFVMSVNYRGNNGPIVVPVQT